MRLVLRGLFLEVVRMSIILIMRDVDLKDINDVFMDSGAGKESFNVISQGTDR